MRSPNLASRPVQVAVLSNNRLFLDVFTEWLSSTDHYQVTAWRQADAFLTQLIDREDQIVVLDVEQDSAPAIQLARQIKLQAPSVGILVYLRRHADQLTYAHYQHFVHALVSSEMTAGEALSELRYVAEGGRDIRHPHGASGLRPPTRGAHRILSPREFAVINHYAAARSAKEISFLERVSVTHVNRCRQRAMRLLGARSSSELVVEARRFGFA